MFLWSEKHEICLKEEKKLKIEEKLMIFFSLWLHACSDAVAGGWWRAELLFICIFTVAGIQEGVRT